LPTLSPANDVKLTVREVAAALRIGKSTVYRLIQKDELLALRIGRSLRVPLAALHRYIEAGGNKLEDYVVPAGGAR